MNNVLQSSTIVQSKFHVVDGFLDESVNTAFLNIVNDWKGRFGSSVFSLGAEVSSEWVVDESKRKSLMIRENLEPILTFMKFSILKHKSLLEKNFDYVYDWQKPCRAEVVASNDGDFFMPHVDSDYALSDEERLKVSMVYYFNREPKPFTGGELFIWDRLVNEAGEVELDEFAHQGSQIEPFNNRAIFFDSSALHEVLPVSCPSKDFADSRFAITMGFN